MGGRGRGRERRTNLGQEGVPSEGGNVVLLLLSPPGGEHEPLHPLLHAVPAVVRSESGNTGNTSGSGRTSSSGSPVVERFHERGHAIAAVGFIRLESEGGGGGGFNRRRTGFAPDRHRKAFRAVSRCGARSRHG